MIQVLLRRSGQVLRVGLPLGLLIAAMLLYYSQNFTSISRQGDFTLATSETMSEQFPPHFPHGDPPRTDHTEAPPLGVASAIAKRFLLTRRSGFAYANRGHSTSFTSEIPEFPDTSTFLKAVNKQLRREYLQMAAEFTAIDWTTVYEGWKDPQSYLMNWDGSVGLDIIHASPTAVSLLESRYEYTGGAHGNLGVVGRCFIEKQGEVHQLQLNELFDSSSPWDRRLVAYVVDDLRQQGASSIPPEIPDDSELQSFSTEDLSSFTLSASELTFYFSPYHVGCYAEGVYIVNVPYNAIQDLIPEDSPARRFMVERVR